VAQDTFLLLQWRLWLLFNALRAPLLLDCSW
jgi:hypothetical protein